ncbi:hypothetical protein LSH36_301g01010 [Paralvinella palmiformis]|uniref:NADPH-dependent diflavin oxidoreductase 1 n=1 Tax=Paralvinella palmiformis TaxID=53620 RepID=A0AAD9JIR1_9ANNE|nr:hypothetical protein LSH36_301g01010 [Paralvinella palmiformis]
MVKKIKTDHYKCVYDKPGRQILLLFGTEYGFSEEIAKKLFDRICLLESKNGQLPWQPRVVNAKQYECIDFSREHVLFVVISTAGDGIPPTEARHFSSWLLAYSGDLSHIKYSVLALGDSNYPHFCRTGITVDRRLSELHSQQIVPCHKVDMEDWDVINRWTEQIITCLDALTVEPCLDYLVIRSCDNDSTPLRNKPFLSRLKIKRLLTSDKVNHEDQKETIHCEFDLTGSEITWTAGDALGIYPENNPPEVDHLLKALNATGDEMVDVPTWAYHNKPDNQVSLKHSLMKYFDLKTIRPELMLLLQREADGTSCQNKLDSLLKEGLSSKKNTFLHEYLYEREVADILEEFCEVSSHLSPLDILNQMKGLQPRYYSISSSPLIDKDTCCVTVAVVRYITLGKPRTGVTTTYLQDRLTINQSCPVFISENPEFRLPANTDIPMIMIGPGTGIAPFMAFISERYFKKATGINRLYFGCRHQEGDFLYREELEHWAHKGFVQLCVAFSRDQPEKVYVQHLIRKDADLLWEMINDQNAHIYVCGDAKHMAKDVHKELVAILMNKGNMTEIEAEKFLTELESKGCYQKDVWVA